MFFWWLCWKSCLVILGNHQAAGIHYNETFALIAKMTTLHTFLAIVASKNGELHQMDVTMLSCMGIFMRKFIWNFHRLLTLLIPNWFVDYACHLYALKHGPRYWFAKLVATLKRYIWFSSILLWQLFVSHGPMQIDVLVHVDDLIISGNNYVVLKVFNAYLSDCFKMKNLGHFEVLSCHWTNT